MSLIQGAIAATRFGMGARPGEIRAAAGDPRGWLKAQVRTEAAVIPAAGLKSSKDIMVERQEAYGDRPRRTAAAGSPPDAETTRTALQMVQREARDGLALEVDARAAKAAATPDSFAERWVRFWSNHFTVAARNAQLIGLVGPFEREAIRPNVFGSFGKLLHAATFHPGMLVYLDATRSVGPASQAGQRRDLGLNENLAREVLELHTMGVGSGYSQADIIEFAKALTGWTVGVGSAAGAGGAGAGKGPRDRAQRRMNEDLADRIGETIFASPRHEPGTRTVLGKSYPGAREQAPAILADLSRHPSTARRLATKLACHFVADAPPASAVAKLERSFRTSDGDLAALARAVIDLDEAWGEQPAKFKTPDELLVSVARATGRDGAFGRNTGEVYRSLSQPPFGAPAPAGWPDQAAAWAGPDAIMKRLEWANAASVRIRGAGTPSDFLDTALGPLAGERTREAVARAESASQGFSLALMSPEFQRR